MHYIDPSYFNTLNLIVLSMFYIFQFRLHPWRYQTCWLQVWCKLIDTRPCWGLCEQPVGNCVRWLMEHLWCTCRLQTAWLLWHR